VVSCGSGTKYTYGSNTYGYVDVGVIDGVILGVGVIVAVTLGVTVFDGVTLIVGVIDGVIVGVTVCVGVKVGVIYAQSTTINFSQPSDVINLTPTAGAIWNDIGNTISIDGGTAVLICDMYAQLLP
jgi:hypothetical protein